MDIVLKVNYATYRQRDIKLLKASVIKWTRYRLYTFNRLNEEERRELFQLFSGAQILMWLVCDFSALQMHARVKGSEYTRVSVQCAGSLICHRN